MDGLLLFTGDSAQADDAVPGSTGESDSRIVQLQGMLLWKEATQAGQLSQRQSRLFRKAEIISLMSVRPVRVPWLNFRTSEEENSWCFSEGHGKASPRGGTLILANTLPAEHSGAP